MLLLISPDSSYSSG
jgi:hypothetical protein